MARVRALLLRSSAARLEEIPCPGSGQVLSSQQALIPRPWRRYRLHIVGEVSVDVRHCLMALPGVAKRDLRRVQSHPQACPDPAETKSPEP